MNGCLIATVYREALSGGTRKYDALKVRNPALWFSLHLSRKVSTSYSVRLRPRSPSSSTGLLTPLTPLSTPLKASWERANVAGI